MHIIVVDNTINKEPMDVLSAPSFPDPALPRLSHDPAARCHPGGLACRRASLPREYLRTSPADGDDRGDRLPHPGIPGREWDRLPGSERWWASHLRTGRRLAPPPGLPHLRRTGGPGGGRPSGGHPPARKADWLPAGRRPPDLHRPLSALPAFASLRR